MTYLNPWQDWADELARVLIEGGFFVQASDIVPPPDATLGDLAIPFFRAAKARSTTPPLCAEEARAILLTHTLVESAHVAGPYLNVRLRDEALTQTLQAIREEMRPTGAYGGLQTVDAGEIVFEYANPNTHKEIHVGHLRNFVTGVAYQRLWQSAGVNVRAVQFVNDQGANVAKTLWMMVKRCLGERYHDKSLQEIDVSTVEWILKELPEHQKTGKHLGSWYADAVADLDQKPEASLKEAAEISFIQAQLEAHDAAWERLWRETRDWCLRELEDICQEMGIHFDEMRSKPYLESDLLDEASRIVATLVEEGKAVRSEGALVVPLADEKLGVAMVQKSDGNLLYLSKDLALAEQKKRDYPAMQASVVLVDQRQSLHFRQLAGVLDVMGYGTPYTYLDYGLLTLKEGTMSSRKGNVITYQSVRDELLAYAEAQTRARHAEWSEEEVKATARAIAFGGMKFALLKQDPHTTFVFDREQALAFEGMTGPYCQYAVVRLRSILAKVGAEPRICPPNHVWEPAERALLLAIASLPNALKSAVGWKEERITIERTNPAALAQWCFSTAQAINAFYRDLPVLDAPSDVRARRLMLAEEAAQTLTNGLAMLTIDVPEKM